MRSRRDKKRRREKSERRISRHKRYRKRRTREDHDRVVRERENERKRYISATKCEDAKRRMGVRSVPIGFSERVKTPFGRC